MYWSLLKIFLNKKNPLIPPLCHEYCFTMDFKEKTELFNSFFSNQCSLLNSCSKLSTNTGYVTDMRLCTINFTANNTEKNRYVLIQTKPMVMTTSVHIC